MSENETSYFDYTACSAEALEERAGAAAPQSREKGKRTKKVGGLRKAAFSAGLGLCFGLFAGAGFYGIKLGTEYLTKEEVSEADVDAAGDMLTAPVIGPAEATHITYVHDDVSDVVAEVMPAMVSIVNSYTSTSYNIWGQTYSRQNAASGSGIIVAENANELLIVSNNHVVDGAEELEITFIDGTTAQAVIKGVDAEMDLAVVAVSLNSLSAETREAITVATLGDSENLKLGEPVIAIGNALGIGQSVTDGIVSALNRELSFEDGSQGTYIQTNAEINEGNSGGALLNIRGEVIGINSSKIAGSKVEGMGYAIPISSASPIIADLMKDKVPEEEVGYIGITMQEITDQVIQMYHMPQGVFVYDVEEGSPAQAAGIMKQDIIVQFDDRKITSASSLKRALQYYKAGDTATITVMRQVNGEYASCELEITLGERPEGR
ncbi:MAG: trypsin-like peptidase domain-containing protein [Lachnospiraceae bacterium]|nr:trypsin-like peptidase domain-containing protein [Butyrivibrio sp.]MCM1343551.1 trypsin-like peptidase domain-containing protein [Muribaculaceae bacterium]MCM1410586.1 trypsin-like peptidase domain-containing protein [Lachnospiraceae bacterium]